jgi:hypothetical protein
MSSETFPFPTVNASTGRFKRKQTRENVCGLCLDANCCKGCSGPFLEGGDSGSLVFSHDNNNQKQVFAYGVCEVDELLLPEQHE